MDPPKPCILSRRAARRREMAGIGGGSSSWPARELHQSPPQLVAVLYTASASRHRAHTSVQSYALHSLLRGYGVAMDERDVSKDNALMYELRSLLAARGCPFSLPQLLVGGRLMGGADEIRQLHEADELRPLLEGAPRQVPVFVCERCMAVKSEPCLWCHTDLEKKHKVVLLDATKDVSMGGSGIEMEAPIGGSLGAMRPLVNKLDVLLSPQGCKLPNVLKDRMHLLKDDLEELRAHFEDLSELEDPPVVAKCWMKAADELSYDIADYIDNLVPLEVASPRSVRKLSHVKISKRIKWQKNIEYAAAVSEHGIKKKTSICRTNCVDAIRVPRRPKWYHQIVERISEFRIYIQETIGLYERYDLHGCSTSVRRFVPVGPMLPIVLPSCDKTYSGIVIDCRTSEFINSLSNDGDQQLKVVSVLGSGCLGKTTLAKVLYKNTGWQFHCRALIRVSKKPDMIRLFQDMLSQIQKQQPQDDYNEFHITDKIREHLLGKRYLIILDDLWDISAWDLISTVFPKGSQGSRIITTTQLEDVALACCCSDNVFEMKPLDDDHSRILFFDRPFGSERDCPEEFKQVSGDIVEICGGLPLATASIASILANQPAVSMVY